MSAPPILREVPDRFESERLLIRAPLPGDGPDVHAAITESHFPLLRSIEVKRDPAALMES